MKQIVKYKWENWEPVFILDDGTKIRLFGQNVALRVGKKHCIGYYKNGKRFKCTEKTVYESVCEQCQKEDEYFMCIRCAGECLNPKKRIQCINNTYAIYLAAFDSLIKIGISVDFRLMERLVEQGADFGARLVTVDDGKAVRKMEQKIKSELEIVDKVSGDKKSEKIFGDPNKSVQELAKKINEIKGNGMPLLSPEIYDLRHYYRLQNVLSQPTRMEISEGTELEGTCIAAKGNIIIIKNSEWQMFNAHRMIGREVDSLQTNI
ncbi:MAG: DUF2797 domain-containing protein [Candidatus Aenigmarchaeota archaeon]|nr:DUF2797 domain-containing protein [Candidatus Aenigmarchaeota archaeon]